MVGQGTIATVESTHEYVNNGKYRGCVEFDVAEAMDIVFDDRCSTEDGGDWLAFYATEEDLVAEHPIEGCKFSGTNFGCPLSALVTF